VSALAALYAPHAWFLAVWIASPIVLIVATRSWLTPSEAPTSHPIPTTRVDVAAMALAALFFCLYISLVLYGEDFVGADYAQLTAHQFFPMPIWPENRRFFPLGLQEYNLLGLIGKYAALYHAWSVVQLGVVIACVFRILESTPLWLRCAVCLFVAVVPSIAYAFFGLIYPERDIIFWMSIWMVCLQAYWRTGSSIAFACALIAVQWMLYYKEIVFLMVGTFAVGKMLADAYLERPLKNLAAFGRAHALELSHVMLCAVFLGVYLMEMRSSTGASYAINVGRQGAALAALQFYMRWDLPLAALLIAIVFRVAMVATRRRRIDPVWDALAVSAVIYVLAYVKLAMIKDYYPAPADFIAVLYLARLMFAELATTSRVVRFAMTAIIVLTFARNVRQLAYATLSRKEYVAANKQMVDALQRVSRSERLDTISLYFPKVGGFQLMEFSAYLRYRGFYLPGDSTPRRPDQPVAIVRGPHRYVDERCEPFQYFRCAYAPERAAGDFVIYLPGRAVSADDLKDLGASPLFHFVPGSTGLERALDRVALGEAPVDRPAHSYVFRP